MTKRESTRPVIVGNVQIGGNNNVVIQSMTNTKTKDVESTVKQINSLALAGCQIVRATCQDMDDAKAIKEIKEKISIPLVADIHFDYRIALEAIKNGIDKIRINPGNIGSKEKVEAVVKACKEHNIPIRIGVNAGSLERELLDKYGHPCAEALVESAKKHVKILEELDFHDIVISLKSSDVNMAIDAYTLAADEFVYPLHIGITETGPKFKGTIKSAAGIGVILHKGIGSTARVSLSADPVEEIRVLKEILKNFDLISDTPTLISCPTCGRTDFDLIDISEKVDKYLESIDKNIKVAVMGCVVNGPGEAREADLGIAGGKEKGVLFKAGKVLRTVNNSELYDELIKEIDALVEERG